MPDGVTYDVRFGQSVMMSERRDIKKLELPEIPEIFSFALYLSHCVTEAFSVFSTRASL